MFKWICAVAGYFLLGKRIGGAILGFFIGSAIDQYLNSKKVGGQANGQSGNAGNRSSSGSFDPFDYYRQQQSSSTDFASMLMVLSAAVMKSDGKVVVAELNYVKGFLKQQFGEQNGTQHLQTLKQYLNASSLPLREICNDINRRTTGEIRIQLIHYLFGIAKADGDVAESEVRTIEQIAGLFNVPNADFVSVKNMFFRDAESDYKILGVLASSTDEEIKKAYRSQVLKYHPDKVAQMGEEYQIGAKEKFQSIQNAYENLKKKRGIK